MGKAVRASSTFVRVSKKAREVYRQVAPGWAGSDGDLAHHIGALIDVTADRPHLVVTDINHPDAPTYVHGIAFDGDVNRYAVVRDGCCVTLLTPSVVERNMRGTWVPVTAERPFLAPAMCGAHQQSIPCGGCAREAEAGAGGRPAPVLTFKLARPVGTMHSCTLCGKIHSTVDPCQAPVVTFTVPPIVIDHGDDVKLIDLVHVTDDGIELLLDSQKRVRWEMSRDRGIELRDALALKLPPDPPAPRDVEREWVANAEEFLATIFPKPAPCAKCGYHDASKCDPYCGVSAAPDVAPSSPTPSAPVLPELMGWIDTRRRVARARRALVLAQHVLEAAIADEQRASETLDQCIEREQEQM